MKTTLLTLSFMALSALSFGSSKQYSNHYEIDLKDPMTSTYREIRIIFKTVATKNFGNRIKQGYKVEKVLDVSSGKDIFVLVKS